MLLANGSTCLALLEIIGGYRKAYRIGMWPITPRLCIWRFMRENQSGHRKEVRLFA